MNKFPDLKKFSHLSSTIFGVGLLPIAPGTWSSLAALFLFIAAHAIGQGSVIWVYISEIFPNHIRSSGQSFGTSTHWILAALIPSMIPFLFSKIGASYVFLIFLLMMIFQLIFVVFSMPETKGKSLETLSNELLK